jgi:integrase
MARPSKPWYWKARDAWFVNHKGKRHLLAKGKAQRANAYREYLKLTEKPSLETVASGSAEAIFEKFMVYAKANLKPKTLSGYEHWAAAFCRSLGNMDANTVLPRHVSDFINDHPGWNPTTRRNAIGVIKRVWSWALAEGLITINQISSIKRPRPRRRETIPDDKEFDRYLAAASPLFRDVLTFIRETGCRPGEVALIERRFVDTKNHEIRFPLGLDKVSGRTGRHRVIQLNHKAMAMIADLMAEHPTGPLFRNSKGNAWCSYSMNCATRAARKKAGLEDVEALVPYSLRHQYLTDALAKGVPIALLAEMCGTSPAMIAKVYSHISEKKALLLEAARRVRPDNMSA